MSPHKRRPGQRGVEIIAVTALNTLIVPLSFGTCPCRHPAIIAEKDPAFQIFLEWYVTGQAAENDHDITDQLKLNKDKAQGLMRLDSKS